MVCGWEGVQVWMWESVHLVSDVCGVWVGGCAGVDVGECALGSHCVVCGWEGVQVWRWESVH